MSSVPAGRSVFAVILTIQTLLLAFILASFPVRNADFWSQLAAGRLIANGDYHFGTDPFAYTTEGCYWANHAWLFDLLLYAAYTAIGNGVVVLKAAFVVGIAAVMISCRRPGSGTVLPALVTALALFVMAPHLLLNSTLASVGLLAATVAVLVGPKRVKAAHVIPPLMALWVNLDGWFILGPIAVGLVMFGERLGTPADERRVPMWLVVGSFASCLINPHHAHAFTLPPEISPSVLRSSFPEDPRFQHLFEPSWRWQRYTDPAGGLNAGGLGFLALLLFGLVSFCLNRSAVRSGRFVLWLGFAGLAAWNQRLALFFAVVGGPIGVLNLQDFFATRPPHKTPLTPRRSLGQGMVCLIGVGVLALAWVGWLQAPMTDERKVGWEVQPDPGLRRGAEERAAWRKVGRIAGGERAFHTHPDSAAYAAWFAPGEKCFLDARLSLFLPVADEYRTICQAAAVIPGDEALYAKVTMLLRDRAITHVVLHDSELERVERGFSHLARPGSGTALLQISGREATFGLMSEPREGKPFTEWLLDVTHGGFRAGDRPARIPATAPQDAPEGKSCWNRILAELGRPFDAPRPRPAELDEAALYLLAFRAELQAAPAATPWSTPTLMAALIASGSPIGGAASSLTADVVLKSAASGLLYKPGTPPSPSAAYLAIRAARSAVAAAPNDPLAHYRLGQAYVSLSHSTREHEWVAEFRPLAQVRHVQAVFALERAVALDPDLAGAHGLLVKIYRERRMVDAALLHLREQVRITKARTTVRGTGDNDQARELLQLLAEVESVVQEQRREFSIRAPKLAVDLIGRTQAAINLGLPLAALDEVLLVSDTSRFGAEGVKLELELLSMLGRTARLREELYSEELKQVAVRLGTFELLSAQSHRPYDYRLPAYNWFRLLAAAGFGHHSDIESILVDLDSHWRQDVTRAQADVPDSLFLSLFQSGLASRPETWPLQAVLAHERQRLSFAHAANRIDLQTRADLKALAGVFALERGDIGSAEEHFRMALQIAVSPDVQGSNFAAEAMCRGYLAYLEAARTKN